MDCVSLHQGQLFYGKFRYKNLISFGLDLAKFDSFSVTEACFTCQKIVFFDFEDAKDIPFCFYFKWIKKVLAIYFFKLCFVI